MRSINATIFAFVSASAWGLRPDSAKPISKSLSKSSGNTSTHDYTLTHYKVDSGDTGATLDTVEAITVAAASMPAQYGFVDFNFTSTSVISKGDAIIIGLNSNKTSNINYYLTVVFEWDYNS